MLWHKVGLTTKCQVLEYGVCTVLCTVKHELDVSKQTVEI